MFRSIDRIDMLVNEHRCCSRSLFIFSNYTSAPSLLRFLQRSDDLTGGSGRVLQADVSIDAGLACRIYDSCKSVAIVGETTAMQSGLVRTVLDLNKYFLVRQLDCVRCRVFY